MDNLVDDTLFRYFLNEVSTEEREEIEVILNNDHGRYGRLREAENKMIWAGVLKTLSSDREERFEEYIQQTDDRYKRYNAATSIINYKNKYSKTGLIADLQIFLCLLGELNEKEKQNIQARIFRDREFEKDILVAEEELIIAFIMNDLTPYKMNRCEKIFINIEGRHHNFGLFKMMCDSLKEIEKGFIPKVIKAPSPFVKIKVCLKRLPAYFSKQHFRLV